MISTVASPEKECTSPLQSRETQSIKETSCSENSMLNESKNSSLAEMVADGDYVAPLNDFRSPCKQPSFRKMLKKKKSLRKTVDSALQIARMNSEASLDVNDFKQEWQIRRQENNDSPTSSFQAYHESVSGRGEQSSRNLFAHRIEMDSLDGISVDDSCTSVDRSNPGDFELFDESEYSEAEVFDLSLFAFR